MDLKSFRLLEESEESNVVLIERNLKNQIALLAANVKCRKTSELGENRKIWEILNEQMNVFAWEGILTIRFTLLRSLSTLMTRKLLIGNATLKLS